MGYVLWILMALMMVGCEQSEETKSAQATSPMVGKSMSQAMKNQEARGVAEFDKVGVNSHVAKIADLQDLAMVEVLSMSKTVLIGDAAKGARLAKRKCAACHYFDKSRKKSGPSLQGIYGKVPTISGVPFDVWDAAALDLWITNPRAVKKKTRMGFRGMKNAQERLDLIAYLRGLS